MARTRLSRSRTLKTTESVRWVATKDEAKELSREKSVSHWGGGFL